jgi:hypothetical protein
MATNTRKAQAHQDAAAVKELLLWARANKFAVHGVTVGAITITCADIAGLTAPARNRGKADTPAPPPSNIYEDMGGDAWKNAVAASEERDPDDDGDEDDDE